MENSTSKAEFVDADKKIEAIIRTIAAKHGIALGRNDPILVLHTLNELLIKDFANKQEELVHQFRLNLEQSAYKWDTNTNKLISDLLLKLESRQLQLFNSFNASQCEDIKSDISKTISESIVSQQKKIIQYQKAHYKREKTLIYLVTLNIGISILLLVFIVWAISINKPIIDFL